MGARSFEMELRGGRKREGPGGRVKPGRGRHRREGEVLGAPLSFEKELRGGERIGREGEERRRARRGGWRSFKSLF